MLAGSAWERWALRLDHWIWKWEVPDGCDQSRLKGKEST